MRPEFDLQPTLTGSLLELRPLRADDFDALFAAAGDPLIWEQHPEPDRHTRPVFQRYFDGAMASGGAFAVIERKTGRLIGSTRYHDYKPEGSQMEIGFTFLERRFWGGEYNGEMKQLMLGHAFKFVERVVLVIGKENLRSQRAALKIGAVPFGTVQRANRHGTPREDLVFAITRTDWLKKAAIV